MVTDNSVISRTCDHHEGTNLGLVGLYVTDLKGQIRKRKIMI